MAVTTPLPSSLPSSRGAAAAAGASRAGGVSSRRVESSADAAKEPKRPRSCHGDEPPAKRHCTGKTDASSDLGPGRMVSAAEKDGVNRSLIHFLPPGCSPHEVNSPPDSAVSVLQENGTRCGGGADGDEEMEVDLYALRDEALRAIKDGVGVYVEGREEEAPSQSKERVTRLSGPRSIPSRAAPKNIPSRAAPERIVPRSNMPTSLFVPAAAPLIDLSKAPFMRTPPRTTLTTTLPRAASKNILPRSAAASIPSMSIPTSEAEFNSITLPAKTAISNSIPLPAKTAISNSVPLRAKSISLSLQRGATPTASTLLLAPPKPSVSGEFQTKPVKTVPQRSAPATASPSPPAPPKLFGSTELSELLYAANKACEKFVARRQEIEKLRAAARQELELMVRTVEFNDPYIDYTDVFK